MTKARLRKWGSSLGIVVPKEIVDEQRLSPGDEIEIEVRPARTLKDLFGTWKDVPIDAQKFKDEMRKEDKRRDEILSRFVRNNRTDYG